MGDTLIEARKRVSDSGASDVKEGIDAAAPHTEYRTPRKHFA